MQCFVHILSELNYALLSSCSSHSVSLTSFSHLSLPAHHFINTVFNPVMYNKVTYQYGHLINSVIIDLCGYASSRIVECLYRRV